MEPTQSNSKPEFALPEGVVLQDRYVIGTVLGTPTRFTITYGATDQSTQAKVTVRELFVAELVSRSADGVGVQQGSHESGKKFAYAIDQFLTKARAIPTVKHDSIFSNREVFESNGTAYQVMDYIEGMPLKDYLEKSGGRISVQDAMRLVEPLLDGLALLHGSGGTHSMINPKNVRVIRQIDGYALVLMGLGNPRKLETVDPAFTAPEAQGTTPSLTPAADVYSVAALCYYMISGILPQDSTKRLQEDKLTPLTKLVGSISDATSTAIHRALHPSVNDRTGTTQGFKAALQGKSRTTAPAKQSLPDSDAPVIAGNPFDQLEDDLNASNADAPDETIDFGDDGGTLEGEYEAPVSSGGNRKVWLIVAASVFFFMILPFIVFFFMVFLPLMQIGNEFEQQFQQEFDSIPQENMNMQSREMEDPERPPSMDREDASLLVQQGNAAMSSGDFQSAIGLYERAIEKVDNQPELYLYLANAHQAAENASSAEQAYRQALRIDPNFAQAHAGLGRLYFEIGREGPAFQSFDRAVSLGDEASIKFLLSLAQAGSPQAQQVLQKHGISY